MTCDQAVDARATRIKVGSGKSLFLHAGLSPTLAGCWKRAESYEWGAHCLNEESATSVANLTAGRDCTGRAVASVRSSTEWTYSTRTW